MRGVVHQISIKQAYARLMGSVVLDVVHEAFQRGFLVAVRDHNGVVAILACLLDVERLGVVVDENIPCNKGGRPYF